MWKKIKENFPVNPDRPVSQFIDDHRMNAAKWVTGMFVVDKNSDVKALNKPSFLRTILRS